MTDTWCLSTSAVNSTLPLDPHFNSPPFAALKCPESAGRTRNVTKPRNGGSVCSLLALLAVLCCCSPVRTCDAAPVQRHVPLTCLELLLLAVLARSLPGCLAVWVGEREVLRRGSLLRTGRKQGRWLLCYVTKSPPNPRSEAPPTVLSAL